MPNYARVKYANVYPGVDLIYYGNQRQLEYDFVVQPGADPGEIALTVQSSGTKLKGRGDLRLDGNSDLVMSTGGGEVRFHKPVVYQSETGANRLAKDREQSTRKGHLVEGRYRLKGNRVSFELASYDKRQPLVIDPTLAYSSFLGGTEEDDGSGIAVDGSGNAYVTGFTEFLDFPTTLGAFQTTQPGFLALNAFVSKLNPTGSALVYSTYLGGSVADDGFGIALDASGNAYVTGQAGSTDFPTMPGAFQTSFMGYQEAFISKFSFGIPFAEFGGHLRIDTDAGVFSLSSSFTLGSGGSINPLTQQVSFSVGNYSVTVPAGSFFKVSNDYVYQRKVNNIFLCLYIIKNKNTPGHYSLLANSGHDALTGTITSPLPVMLTIGDNSGTTQMSAKFD